MILGTAGHIDHGKTALVRALTGVDTDRLPEEKRRGITIDLGFAPLEVDGVGTIGIVDVPGHEAFIRTMLAGASGIDLALLVIAADEGVMPQTREHLEILSLLGITHGVVALTKGDLVDDEWLALQRDEVSGLFAGNSFVPVDIIPVSAKSGEGIPELRAAIAAAARLVPLKAAEEDLFRMPVDRAFTIRGTGTVVTGTVWSGSISRDTPVIIRPGSRAVRARGIEHHGNAAETAGSGERTALALAGIELGEIERGSVLVSNPAWVESDHLDALIELSHGDFRITPRTRMRLHLGTSESDARISFAAEAEPAGGRAIRARVHLSDPIVARGGDRFVLRLPSPARTIGGGVVLDPYPDVAPRNRKKSGAVSGKVVEGPSPRVTTCRSILLTAGAEGVVVDLLPIRTGLTPGEVAKEIAAIPAVTLGRRAFAESVVTELSDRMYSMIERGAANHPADAGVSIQSVRGSIAAADEVIELAFDRLVRQERIEREGSFVKPAGWKPKLGDRDQAASDAILHEICKHASEPPSVAELAAKFGGKTIVLLRKLERDGKLERISEERYYSSDVVKGITQTMRSTLETGRVYTPAELRGVLGVSRKYLIPFLEYCDRTGITERRQGGRVVRA